MMYKYDSSLEMTVREIGSFVKLDLVTRARLIFQMVLKITVHQKKNHEKEAMIAGVTVTVVTIF